MEPPLCRRVYTSGWRKDQLRIPNFISFRGFTWMLCTCQSNLLWFPLLHSQSKKYIMSEAGPSTSRSHKRPRSESRAKSNRKTGETSVSQAKATSSPDIEDELDEGDDPQAEISAADSATDVTRAQERKTKKAKKAKADASTPGIVYISRLPPGMTPQKVRHLMAKWGDIGKVYAQRRDGELINYPRRHEELIWSSSHRLQSQLFHPEKAETSACRFHRGMGRVPQ
jgi:hypothetical protein